MARLDAIVVGGGHNGLVAAALLARAGRSVLVLEQRGELGGAAVSERPFSGVGARLSRYSYLVSLFPHQLLRELDVRVALRRRQVASYTPCGPVGMLVCDDESATRASIQRSVPEPGTYAALQRVSELTAGVAQRLFPTLTEPLRSREEIRRMVGDDAAWDALFERPLAEFLTRAFESDLARGVVATDALIGTFADLDEASLRQNRCFLYHVIGNGTGHWDVPVGGMGALTTALADAARKAGAQLRTGAPVVAIDSDGESAEVRTADGTTHAATHVLANVAPPVLRGLIGDPPSPTWPEGAQLKLNMVLRRLPRLRDRSISPEQAFAGTFHVNEGYAQLQRAYAQAADGSVPDLPPCETYCHSLTDPSILTPALRAAGAHALTAFVLHMPVRLFREHPEQAKRAAVAATLRSLDSVLDEPVEECLWQTADGRPCLEARSPVELEAELGMPGGHIFHGDLAWPFAESEEEVGRWGVETERPNVWVCGAGARRGGGVSGIAGHNAARAVLAADATGKRA